MKTIRLICLGILSVIAVGLLAAALYFYGKSPFYYAELRKIRKELNEMNGVTVQRIYGVIVIFHWRKSLLPSPLKERERWC